MPLSFFKAVEETVGETLQQGLHGWRVTDCVVTMTHSGYWARQSHSHAVFDKSMSSTARDFRHLTPLVADGRAAGGPAPACTSRSTASGSRSRRTRSARCCPCSARLGAVPQPPAIRGATCTMEGEIPAAQVHELRRRLPGLTRGEGMLETEFDRYQPVRGAIPSRPRTGLDPRDREGYVRRLRSLTP